MVHRIKEFYRRIVDRCKGRTVKNYYCNWPELNNYCGCCKLSTGIYIKSILTVVFTTIAILFNSTFLNLIISSPFLNNGNLTILEDYLNISESNVVHIETITWVLHYLIVYYIIWICFKIFYLIIVIISVYGVFRKKTKLLKVMICISIPNWIIDFFVSVTGLIFIRLELKILLLISNIAEGYNILAIKSVYKRLRGKSRLVQESELYDPSVTVIYPNGSYISSTPPYIHPNGHQLHCRTCSCYNNRHNSDGGRLQISNNEAENIQQTDVVNNVENNAVNLELNTEGADAGANASNTRATRPDMLDYSLQNVRGHKIDIADIPVIYDEQQLNVGTSPVVEDRLQVQEDVLPSGPVLNSLN